MAKIIKTNNLPIDLNVATDLFFVFRAEELVPDCNLDENAGMDFRLDIGQPITVEPYTIHKLPLGFKIAFPSGFELQIRPRSGLSLTGLVLPNSPATIDPSYRGEVHVVVSNISHTELKLQPLQRVCQGVISNYLYNRPYSYQYRIFFIVNEKIFTIWSELFPTKRDVKGFGSSGVM